MNRRTNNRIKLALTGYAIEMERYDETAPKSYYTEIESVDLSDTGIKLRSSVSFPVNSFLCIVLIFRGKKSLFFGMVRWKKPEGSVFEYGVFFNTWAHLDPALEKVLLRQRSFSAAFKLRSWVRGSKDMANPDKAAWQLF